MATAGDKSQRLEDPVAHSVAVQLPVFNHLSPSSWFHLADANFHLHGITKSDTKFWYVMSKLDQETLCKLSAFLAKPRGDDPYGEIRELLCTTYEPQLEQKLDALLAITNMGDGRPSEFTLELRRLLDTASTEDILKRIFVRSLPTRISNAISANMDGSLEALTRAADKAWALSRSTVSAAAISFDDVGAPTSVAAMATPGSQVRGRGTRQRRGR